MTSRVVASIRGALGRAIRKTPLREALRWWREWREIRRWRAGGSTPPPPAGYKRRILRRYGRRHGLRVFVETGTWRGDTVAALRPHFDRLHTIEIHPPFVRRARERFADRGEIQVHEGDSAEVLPRLLEELDEPCLFWLDGHYSGPGTGRGDDDTPVRAELRAILDHPVEGHVILIDDARCFDAEAGYPTLQELRVILEGVAPPWTLEVEDDIVRIVPREGGTPSDLPTEPERR